LSYRPAEQILY